MSALYPPSFQPEPRRRRAADPRSVGVACPAGLLAAAFNKAKGLGANCSDYSLEQIVTYENDFTPTDNDVRRNLGTLDC